MLELHCPCLMQMTSPVQLQSVENKNLSKKKSQGYKIRLELGVHTRTEIPVMVVQSLMCKAYTMMNSHV